MANGSKRRKKMKFEFEAKDKKALRNLAEAVRKALTMPVAEAGLIQALLEAERELGS